MRSGLFWKLFLLQVLAAATVLAGALAFSRTFSVRGFGEYVEARQRERAQEVAEQVAQNYHGDLAAAAAGLPAFHPRRRPQPGDAPPPDEPEGMRRGPGEHGPPLQLQDTAGHFVMGDEREHRTERIREAVTVDGKVVGYVAWPQFPLNPEQQAFAHRQAEHLKVIIPVALAVAALFAALITGLIVGPIRRLSAGAAALARREFATRVPAATHDELGALARDFNTLAAALEGYDTRQRQWLADIAHELRTPVSVLRGEIEAVIEGVRPATVEAARSLREETSRLEALIDDLHLVSLAESGGLRLNLSEVDVSTLVAQSVERFRERLAARGFEVRVEAGRDVRTRADSQRLSQVLANLLENVLVHARAPGSVVVTAHAAESRVVIGVADGGPGVPAAALPKLFDRLYRTEDARTRATGGAGLGLAICRSIVEQHGGTIRALASTGGGLEIRIELPQ